MAEPENRKLVEEIGQGIDWYSTALLRLRTDSHDPQEDHLIGSGTLVEIDGHFGIVTAGHVAAEIIGQCALGLILKSDVQRVAIDSGYFTVCGVAVPDENLHEPDLAFIGIHGPDIGTIKAHKIFYNMSIVRDQVLTAMLPISKGVWFIWGVPGEDTTEEPPEKGYERIMGLHSLCAYARVSSEYKLGEFDYVDLEVEYGKEFHVPKSFGGYSGGGIWQVLLDKAEDGTLIPKDRILSGVAFYQTDVNEQIRYIHCHGRRSIYEYLYNKIRNGCI